MCLCVPASDAGPHPVPNNIPSNETTAFSGQVAAPSNEMHENANTVGASVGESSPSILQPTPAVRAAAESPKAATPHASAQAEGANAIRPAGAVGDEAKATSRPASGEMWDTGDLEGFPSSSEALVSEFPSMDAMGAAEYEWPADIVSNPARGDSLTEKGTFDAGFSTPGQSSSPHSASGNVSWPSNALLALPDAPTPTDTSPVAATPSVPEPEVRPFDSPRLVSVMFSMPLREVLMSRAGPVSKALKRFNVANERNAIFQACRPTGNVSRVCTQFMFGSLTTFESVLKQGCRVLILSGHCNGQHMYMEGQQGGADLVDR